MPGPKTHDIFYKSLKEKLNKKTLDSFPNYDKYNIFVQGHDFLIYYDFYNSKVRDANIENSIHLEEHRFQEFVYNYLAIAKESGALENGDVRLFIGPGYVMHHLLDAYTHPQIIYYSGDHTRNPETKIWNHGVVENLLDIYMMETYEKIDARTYKVYKDFEINRDLVSSELITTINDSLGVTYGINNGGEIFEKAFQQLAPYMWLMKYDYLGLKAVFFDKVLGPFVKCSKAFSYHRDFHDALPYLNLEHEEWLNPTDGSISTESFLDLFEKSLNDGAQIVDELENICQSGSIHRDDIYSIIPNISSVHGLECERPFQLKYTKTTNNR